MSFSSFVKKEIEKHNKEIEEKGHLESTSNYDCSSENRENVGVGSLNLSRQHEESLKSVIRTLQNLPVTKEPPPVPRRPPTAREPSQGNVLDVDKNQKLPFPMTSSYQLPHPPNPPLLTPSSTPLPPPPDLISLQDKKSNLGKKKTLSITSIAPNLPPRPPSMPPPPPIPPPPPRTPSLEPQQASNIPDMPPAVTKESTTEHQSNSNRISDDDMHVPATRSVHRPFELQRPLQPPQKESPMNPMFSTPFVVKEEDSGSSFKASRQDSDAYVSSEEFEEKPENAEAPSAPSSNQVSKSEDRVEPFPFQSAIDDFDDDWQESDGDDDSNKMDSSDTPEVHLRHKRGSHGLATKPLNNAIDISIAMKYVSGFYNLPVLEDVHSVSPVEEGIRNVLWKDLPEVKCNPIFKKMDDHRRKLYDTIFEIMTTEALFISLLNSFEEQKSYFPTEEVLASSDREMLFSRLLLVKQCAEAFYEKLEGCWQESIFLHGIFDAIEKHVNNNFSVYVKYCTNQGRINKMFDKAKNSLGLLSPQLKAFQSFLMLPMQRVARLPALIESILQQMPTTDPEYPACKRALTAIRKKAVECSEDAQSGDRMSGLLELSSRFVFPDDLPPFPLISASRWLKKRTQATRRWRLDDENKTPKEDVEMFLFNDVFFICSKKKRDDSFLVQSYCRHSLVEMTPVLAEFLPSLPTRYASDRPGKYVLVVDLLCNQNGRREIMVMSMSSQHERDSWLEVAPPPPIPDKSSDICYEPWDCPIVVAVLPFQAATPYQLSLAVNDKMHVTKRKTIGWYEGERLSDRKTGFFPVNYTLEIDSPHKKAREIRERFYPVD